MKKLAFLLLSLIITGCFVDPVKVTPLVDTLEIKSIKPHVIKASQKLTITGTGLNDVTEVTVGNELAGVLSRSDTSLEVLMPTLDQGTFTVTVKKGDKSDTYQNVIVLETASSRPPITSRFTPENNPGYFQGELMVSFSGQFASLEALQNELNARKTTLKVTKFFPALVPNSDGMCGKSLAVLEIPEGETKKDTAQVLEEFRRLYPELQGLDWWGDAHTADLGDAIVGPIDDAAPAGYVNGWGWQASRVPPGYALSGFAKGLQTIKVAVLDTGISPHEEFYRDGINTVIDYANGMDLTSNNNDKTDSYPREGIEIAQGHGTGVAAIIGALNQNQYGVSEFEVTRYFSTMIGVSPGVKIIPIKVCEPQVFFDRNENRRYTALCKGISVAAGICHAIAKQVKVINLSLGGPIRSPIIHGILEEAAKAGISIVASSGNVKDDKFHYPASYSYAEPGYYNAIPGLIAVGAVGKTFDTLGLISLAGYSTKGPWVDVVAPGGSEKCLIKCPTDYGIFTATSQFDGTTTRESNGYQIGTSFAAPFVTGTAALLLAQNPNLTPEAIKAKIKLEGLEMPAGCTSQTCGAGLLDVSKSLGLNFSIGSRR
jgi:Subtilase family/IPT/TIG domain